MSEIKDLLQSITSDNQTKAKEQFDAIIADKVSNALDARKVAVAQKRFNESKQEELDETYNPIGQFKVKKTKQKTIDVPDDDTLEEFEYDIIRSGKKVGEMERLGVGTIYGKLYGKNLPELSSYKGKNPEQKLQSFLKSKTGARWAKNVKELSDIIGESTDLEEGSMDKMSLQDLWMDFTSADFQVDQGYGIGKGSPKWNSKKQDAIYKYVSKKFGKNVADDMADYGATATYADEYAGPDEAPEAEKHMKKLAKKHGIKESTELEEAKKLKVGQEVNYKGKWARVEEIDGDEVTVSDEDGEEHTIDKDQVK